MSEQYIKLDQAPLLFVVCQCVVLAVGLFSTPTDKSLSNRLLGVFILLNGLGAMDALLLWAKPFTSITYAYPNLALIGELTFWLQGPILYWYCQSLLYKQNRFPKYFWIHMVPAVLFFCYLLIVFFSKNTAQKLIIIETKSLISGTTYMLIRTVRHLILIAYCVFTLKLISRYQSDLKQAFSNLANIDVNWLKLLILGELGIVLWGLVIHLTSFYALTQQVTAPGYTMGVIWNYLIFLLVNALVFYNLTHPTIILNPTADSAEKNPPIATETRLVVEHIEVAMTDRKHYLIQELTLDQLAESLSLSSRQVSEALHQHFKMSFFEFINSYRVKHAQQLLSDTDTPIQQVIELSGFNSKSAFNRFFKRITGKNPRQYRQCAQIPQ